VENSVLKDYASWNLSEKEHSCHECVRIKADCMWNMCRRFSGWLEKRNRRGKKFKMCTEQWWVSVHM